MQGRHTPKSGLTVHVCRWTGGSAGGCRAGSTRPFRLSPPLLLPPPFHLKVHAWRLLAWPLLGPAARGVRGAVPLRTGGRPSLPPPQPPPDMHSKAEHQVPPPILVCGIEIESVRRTSASGLWTDGQRSHVQKRGSLHLGDKVADLGSFTTSIPLGSAAMASRTAYGTARNQ